MIYALNECIVTSTEPCALGVVMVSFDVNAVIGKAIAMRDKYINDMKEAKEYKENEVLNDLCTNESFCFHYVSNEGEEFLLQVEELESVSVRGFGARG